VVKARPDFRRDSGTLIIDRAEVVPP
jgi:hypothetical protein